MAIGGSPDVGGTEIAMDEAPSVQQRERRCDVAK